MADGALSRGRRRAPHLGPTRRRPQVLDAALTIAVRDGYSSVTFGAIAAELGVSRPVVYACFADRVELLTELIDREYTRLLESLLEVLHSTRNGETPEDAFVVGFTGLLENAERRPEPWLFYASEPDPAIAARTIEGRAIVRSEALRWIGAGMRDWWGVDDLDRKLPVLIDFFIASCESAVQSLLDPANDWTAAELGDFLGRAVYRAFEGA